MRALLIGNSAYLPGGSWPSLSGCARDAGRVEAFLRHRMDVPADRIRKLTASIPQDGGAEPPEAPEDRPTYENMIGELLRLAREAEHGEQVLIYFTGHGDRIPTCIPEVKGTMAVDQVLVPWNAAAPDARCLRDVELGIILRDLVERRGALVTLVLDCCHAGAATRLAEIPREVGVRGSDVIDERAWSTDSLVASQTDLEAVWRALTRGGPRRNMLLASGWQPDPRGYVLLAACRAGERAFEFPFEEGEKRGVFTRALLESLGNLPTGQTYRRLHDRIVAEVHSRFAQQNPVLEGDEDRVVFGDQHVHEPPSVNVLRVEDDGKRVLLEAGEVHGVERKARFAIHGTTGEPVALAQVTTAGSAESWSRIEERFRPDPIERGFQAFPYEAGAPRLCHGVRLLPATSIQAQKVLEDVTQQLERGNGRGFVALAPDGEGADFLVTVDELGRCQITDPAGAPLSHVPQPSVQRPGTAQLLVSLLVHLAQFRNIQRLANRDSQSPLRGQLLLETGRPPGDWSQGQRAVFSKSTPVRRIRHGSWIWVRLVNTSMQELSVGLLDLQPDWGISLIAPRPRDGDSLLLGAGEERVLEFPVSLPNGLRAGIDLLKVVAASGRAGFRWLELKPLESSQLRRPVMRGGAVRAPADELEALFAALTATRPPKRSRQPSKFPGREWAVAQLEIEVVR